MVPSCIYAGYTSSINLIHVCLSKIPVSRRAGSGHVTAKSHNINVTVDTFYFLDPCAKTICSYIAGFIMCIRRECQHSDSILTLRRRFQHRRFSLCRHRLFRGLFGRYGFIGGCFFGGFSRFFWSGFRICRLFSRVRRVLPVCFDFSGRSGIGLLCCHIFCFFCIRNIKSFLCPGFGIRLHTAERCHSCHLEYKCEDQQKYEYSL